MSRQFFVEYVDTCPDCNGQKEISNPDWSDLSVYMQEWNDQNPPPEAAGKDEQKLADEYFEYRKREWEAEVAWWKTVHGIVVGDDGTNLPWDVARCEYCAGTGKVSGKVPLDEAIGQIVMASLRRDK